MRYGSVILEPEDLQDVVDHFRTQDSFVFDVETIPGAGVTISPDLSESEHNAERKFYSLDHRRNEVFWISLSTVGECVAIPMGHRNGEQLPGKAGWKPAPMKPGQKKTTRVVPVFDPPPKQMVPGQVFDILKPLFFDERIRKINQNVKFDLLTVAKYLGDIPCGPYLDTMVLQHVLDENRYSYKLGDLVKDNLGYTYDKVGDRVPFLSFSAAAQYSYLDAKETWLLKRKLLRDLYATGDQRLIDYFWFECEVTEVLARMEYNEAPVLTEEVAVLDKYLTGELTRIETSLYQEAGKVFGLTNPADKGWFIYEHCGHEPFAYTPKKKQPSLKAEHLASYTFDSRVQELMDYDSFSKQRSTFVLNYDKYEFNGRIHSTFHQARTVTGRFSSGEPNLQNVPKPITPVGKRIRSLFWSGSESTILVVGDYSQVELRILAHYSNDPTMIAAFQAGEDIHQASADALGCSRDIAKNINFAIPFGAGPGKVAAMGGGKFSVTMAKKFFQLHKERFPQVWAWIEKTKQDCKRNPSHEVRTINGRIRRLPQIRFMDSFRDDLKQMGARASRQAVNTKIQGSAADLIKMAMIRLHDTLDEDMQLILQVHDELIVIAPRDKADRAIALMRQAMEGDVMQCLRVPLTANIAAVERWADAKA